MIRMSATALEEGFRKGMQETGERFLRQARRAVNDLAFRGRDAVREEMGRAFNKPRDYLVDDVRVNVAKDSAPVAEVVWYRDPQIAGKLGRPGGARIFAPHIDGGARRLKRLDKAMHFIGVPAGMIVVPARFAELDAEGDLKGAALVKIISDLKAFSEVGFTANRSTRPSRGRRRREHYFIIRATTPSGLKPGVYLRGQKGKPPQMVLAFVRAAVYRPRFAPARTVREVVARDIRAIWEQAQAGTLAERNRRGDIVEAGR